MKMKLLTLLLLLGFTSPTGSEVVQSFRSKCPQFFIGHLPSAKHEVTTPTVLKGKKYKQICQRWEGQYRYATLYDTKSRIPVYSAYTFYLKDHVKRNNDWKVEPQLDLPLKPENSNMISESDMNASVTSKFKNQALVKDYRQDNSGNITKGHLFPRSYAADQDQADSTFTLTNIAPQTEKSNGLWRTEVETPMGNKIQQYCKPNETNPAYIVTGVVPGETWLPIKRENRAIDQGVNIPSHFWTAFTCTDKNRKISQAYIAQQIYRKDNRQTRFQKQRMTVDELEKKLTELYKQPFSVFRNTKI
ncbi:endonuclease domain-containing 1 protein-like [Colossoma macropomum]|uniref:endonuclease domain-containing 1 protein-like n=1 Tax=Colossoma macropomum TaxID=42526 RepID=UPI001864B9BB|nr:endonuclease domain-containing 1 protein-like [Colossoma macropomum]